MRRHVAADNGTQYVWITMGVTTPHPQLGTAIDVLLRGTVRAHRRR
jgi:hypothetical protein